MIRHKPILLLLFLNLSLFILGALDLGHRGETERLTQQLHPQKMRLEPSSAHTHPAPVEHSASAAPHTLCYDWGPFEEAEWLPASQWLQQLKFKVQPLQQAATPRFWVYIPPLQSAHALREQLNLLKQEQISDQLIVTERSRWNQAISLGVFADRKKADERLMQLHALGIKLAVIGIWKEDIQSLAPWWYARFAADRVPTTKERAALQSRWPHTAWHQQPCDP